MAVCSDSWFILRVGWLGGSLAAHSFSVPLFAAPKEASIRAQTTTTAEETIRRPQHKPAAKSTATTGKVIGHARIVKWPHQKIMHSTPSSVWKKVHLKSGS